MLLKRVKGQEFLEKNPDSQRFLRDVASRSGPQGPQMSRRDFIRLSGVLMGNAVRGSSLAKAAEWLTDRNPSYPHRGPSLVQYPPELTDTELEALRKAILHELSSLGTQVGKLELAPDLKKPPHSAYILHLWGFFNQMRKAKEEGFTGRIYQEVDNLQVMTDPRVPGGYMLKAGEDEDRIKHAVIVFGSNNLGLGPAFISANEGAPVVLNPLQLNKYLREDNILGRYPSLPQLIEEAISNYASMTYLRTPEERVREMDEEIRAILGRKDNQLTLRIPFQDKLMSYLFAEASNAFETWEPDDHSRAIWRYLDMLRGLIPNLVYFWESSAVVIQKAMGRIGGYSWSNLGDYLAPQGKGQRKIEDLKESLMRRGYISVDDENDDGENLGIIQIGHIYIGEFFKTRTEGVYRLPFNPFQMIFGFMGNSEIAILKPDAEIDSVSVNYGGKITKASYDTLRDNPGWERYLLKSVDRPFNNNTRIEVRTRIRGEEDPLQFKIGVPPVMRGILEVIEKPSRQTFADEVIKKLQSAGYPMEEELRMI